MGTNQHHNKHRRDGAVPVPRTLLFTEPHETSGTGTAGFQTWTCEPQRSNVTCSRSLSYLASGSGSRSQFSASHLTALHWPQRSERPKALRLGGAKLEPIGMCVRAPAGTTHRCMA